MSINSKPEKPSMEGVGSICMTIAGIALFSWGFYMLVFQILNPWAFFYGGGYIFSPFLFILGAGLMIPGIIFVRRDFITRKERKMGAKKVDREKLRKTFRRTFKYLCDNCKEFIDSYKEYCEKCGAQNTIREATKEDYVKREEFS
ncbi:MAG: hypothetical protein ACFFB9_05040 [Promethearchaeota archaeon]